MRASAPRESPRLRAATSSASRSSGLRPQGNDLTRDPKNRVTSAGGPDGDCDARRPVEGRVAEWSVEVRVLSGALGKPRGAGFSCGRGRSWRVSCRARCAGKSGRRFVVDRGRADQHIGHVDRPVGRHVHLARGRVSIVAGAVEGSGWACCARSCAGAWRKSRGERGAGAAGGAASGRAESSRFGALCSLGDLGGGGGRVGVAYEREAGEAWGGSGLS